jgi:hypothetical protein
VDGRINTIQALTKYVLFSKNRGRQGASTSFLKERSKKLFIPGGLHFAGQVLDPSTGPESKVF